MKKSILIVEDEIDIAELLKLYLESEGFGISIASNGVEAEKLMDNINFDMALVDIMMPKMNGYDFIKRVREYNLKLPIIVLSAKNLDNDLLELMPKTPLELIFDNGFTRYDKKTGCEIYYKPIKDVLPEEIDRAEESYKREILKLGIKNERLKKRYRSDDGYRGTGIHSFKTEEAEIIELLSRDYEVQQLCSLMGVSRSGYYKWKNAISRNGI